MAKSLEKKIDHLLKSRDFWLVVLVLIYGFYSGLFGYLFNYRIASDTARIEIDYGTRRRAFEGEVLPEMSLLDALLAASRGGNFEVRYALLADRADIMKINGISEDGLNAESWHFYLNRKEVKADEIHKIKIRAGDRILSEFK